MARLCQFVAISLHFEISLDFTSVRPFSRFFLAGQDDFPGRKMKDPRLGASNWSHHMIDIVQTSNMLNQIRIKPKCEWKHCFFTFTLFTSFPFHYFKGQGEVPLGNRFEFQDLNLAQHALSSVANHLLISPKFCKCFNWHKNVPPDHSWLHLHYSLH